MPSSTSEGITAVRNCSPCRCISSRASRQIASSTSRGIMPLAAGTATPAARRRFRPATRTMKNSSRLLAKMARKRVRSSSARSGSSASSSTRALKRSQDSSRSRKRSAGRSSASGSYGGSTSKESLAAGRTMTSLGPSSRSPAVPARSASLDMSFMVPLTGERQVTKVAGWSSAHPPPSASRQLSRAHSPGFVRRPPRWLSLSKPRVPNVASRGTKPGDSGRKTWRVSVRTSRRGCGG